MTGFRWSLLWVVVFAFGPDLLRRVFDPPASVWYLIGAALGAVLILGHVYIEERKIPKTKEQGHGRETTENQR
jgi:hypothetical protein